MLLSKTPRKHFILSFSCRFSLEHITAAAYQKRRNYSKIASVHFAHTLLRLFAPPNDACKNYLYLRNAIYMPTIGGNLFNWNDNLVGYSDVSYGLPQTRRAVRSRERMRLFHSCTAPLERDHFFIADPPLIIKAARLIKGPNEMLSLTASCCAAILGKTTQCWTKSPNAMRSPMKI